MGAGRICLRRGTLLGFLKVKDKDLRGWRDSAIQQILIGTICMYARNRWLSLFVDLVPCISFSECLPLLSLYPRGPKGEVAFPQDT